MTEDMDFEQLFGKAGIKTLGVVGSRTWPQKSFVYKHLEDFLATYPMIDTLVSGGQPKGVDGWTKEYAQDNRLEIIEHLPAHWLPPDHERYATYGPTNYFERNSMIVRDSDVLLAFCHQDSGGTMDTYNKAKRKLGRRAHLFTEDDIRKGDV